MKTIIQHCWTPAECSRPYRVGAPARRVLCYHRASWPMGMASVPVHRAPTGLSRVSGVERRSHNDGC
jgi:hypothetical protein